jgi:hypothetical protein
MLMDLSNFFNLVCRGLTEETVKANGKVLLHATKAYGAVIDLLIPRFSRRVYSAGDSRNYSCELGRQAAGSHSLVGLSIYYK